MKSEVKKMSKLS
jgi:hypothetical protein